VVVNQTLTDRGVRARVVVGVADGSDTGRSTLERVAAQETRVLTAPPPVVAFRAVQPRHGMGDRLRRFRDAVADAEGREHPLDGMRLAERRSMSEPTTARDLLAIERTRLANERTLLAYIRTALALAGGGAGIVGFVPGEAAGIMGVGLLAAGALVLGVGVRRFATVRGRLERVYPRQQPQPS
jgi:putative membrane protein